MCTQVEVHALLMTAWRCRLPRNELRMQHSGLGKDPQLWGILCWACLAKTSAGSRSGGGSVHSMVSAQPMAHQQRVTSVKTHDCPHIFPKTQTTRSRRTQSQREPSTHQVAQHAPGSRGLLQTRRNLHPSQAPASRDDPRGAVG